MTQPASPARQNEFAHAGKVPASPWKRIFRIIRWTIYTFSLITLALVFHKAPPPLVETSPQAAGRTEEKLEQVEKAEASGQPPTRRMDEPELNSYLPRHLSLERQDDASAAAGARHE